MPSQRTIQKSLRLNEDEQTILSAMEIHIGGDESGVLRQGLLKFSRNEGITLEVARKMLEERAKHKPHKR